MVVNKNVIIAAMLNIYQASTKQDFTKLTTVERGCWLSLVNPTDEEIESVHRQFGAHYDYLRAALDREEGARVEHEDGQTLIIFDVPVAKISDKGTMYETLPMSIIIINDKVITVTLTQNEVLASLLQKRPKQFYTNKKSRFALQLLERTLQVYVRNLRQIDRLSRQVEDNLYKSLQNEELMKMFRLQKSLVYFNASLQSIDTMLNKFLRVDYVKNYPGDTELLEDVTIENKQALEMANIYASTLSGTMDAFASIISNNQNFVMKTLTVITVIISIPTLVFSFYGMNVAMPLSHLTDEPTIAWLIPVLISVVLLIVTIFTLWRKKSL